MDIKQKCGYILYFGKARKKLETRYRKARPARGPIHKSPSSPEARKIQARNITTDQKGHFFGIFVEFDIPVFQNSENNISKLLWR